MSRQQKPRSARPSHVSRERAVLMADSARGESTAAGVIETPAAVEELARRLLGQSIIAFDTEFIREKTFYPQLALIQIADRSESWLIDPLAVSKADMAPLLEIFGDPEILKIGHALEQDQECLHHAFGIVAKPILDTAIAAALTGRGDQLGLAVLLRKLLKIKLPKGHTRADWLRRPLPAAMATYARGDVDHLVEAAEILLRDLETEGRREWAMALSALWADASRFEPNPDAIATRLANGKNLDSEEFAVLRELLSWRERRVRKADLPRRWLAEDALLVKLSMVRPASKVELSHFRGLGAKLIEREGDDILAAIRRGAELPVEQRPEPPRGSQPDQDEAAAISVLRCFLNLVAREHRVPSRYLIEPNDVIHLLRGRFHSIADLEASGLLKAGSAAWVGEELIAILAGRRALKVEDGRVRHFELAEEEMA